MTKIVIRENARHGSSRDPVASTIGTPDTTAPLESRRQRRALRGPKGTKPWERATAATSRVRDAWAEPVQIVKTRGTRRRKHRDVGTYTRDIGGSTPCEYAYGTG